MLPLQALQRLLSNPKRIVLLVHHRPDGDALGSALAWQHYLKRTGHQVQIITPSAAPRFLHWMQGIKQVHNAAQSKAHLLEAEQYIQQAEVLCYMDFPDIRRLHGLMTIAERFQGTTLLIDHHREKLINASLEYWDPRAAATAMIVYELIKGLGGVQAITPGMASCLYAGILTDTGSFGNSNTDAKVLQVAATLATQGADPNYISQRIYCTSTLHRLRFIGHALAHRLYYMKPQCTAYFAIPNEDFATFQLRTGDTEGLVDHARTLDKVVLAAVIKSKTPTETKFSLRSKGDFRVDHFANTYLNGGGHKNAAGGMLPMPLPEAVAKFREVVTHETDLLRSIMW